MSGGCGLRSLGRTAPAAAGRDAGMVTAELAVALPALVLATLVALTAVRVAVAQVQTLDAADVAARLAARGETPAAVSAAAAGACAGAHVQVRVVGATVVADAEVTVSPLGLAALLPTFVVHEHAAYATESPVVAS